MKHLFVAFHVLLVMSILLIAALFYLFFQPNGLSLLNTYILPPLGIHTQAEGSLTNGVTLRNLHTNTIDAKTLTLDYNLTAILKGKHIIDSVSIDGLRIHLDDFISGSDNSPLPIPTFALKKVTLTNLQLISSYPVELNLDAKEGSFDGKRLNFNAFNATVASRYASGSLSGRIKNSSISGSALIYQNATELDPYIAKITTLPEAQRVEILELSSSRVQLKALFDRLDANFDPKMSLQNIALSMDYRYRDRTLNFNATHTLLRENESIKIAQKLSYNLNKTTTTSIEGVITSSRPLPSNTITAHFRDDPQGLVGRVVLGGSDLLLQSGDYDHFVWSLTSLNPTLNFLPSLPEKLKDSYLNANAQGSFTATTNTLTGTLNAHHNHGNLDGTFQIHNDEITLNGELFLPSDAPFWKTWALKPPEKVAISLIHTVNSTKIDLNGKGLALSLEQTDDRIKGSGNYLESYFDLNGSTSTIRLSSRTPSLAKTLSLIPSMPHPNIDYYDAEIHTTTSITFDPQISASMDIEIPWYGVIVDSTHQYSGINNILTLHYNDGIIILDKYRLDIADHPIFSNQPSYAHINGVGNFILDDIRIFDTLRLNGSIDPNTLATQLNLTSESFTYEGPEGDAHIAADLHFTRDANATQNLEGSFTILDAAITHLPLQQFKGMDDDIILVQDIRPPSTSSLGINVHITAKHPIEYSSKELKMQLNPDITLWKDPLGAIEILGMVTIPTGSATNNAKHFDIRHSEIYFDGTLPFNPYLNLTIEHEVDYRKIFIYVTHTLESPIFLFTSDPVMSQNDIMSYLLFGAPASASMSNEKSAPTVRADATNFMLGAGLKGLIGGVTKIQLDTMNILTTKEGGMGFEVGTRLNKDLRILYKNDSVSSVLVQYTLNRWLRIDADIHDLGQGINAIYIKDFRDFLPHNKVK
ncbi:MAG: translocation/assembly module TamB domain-containing protein [Campylobacterales bacterium]|nr:translocation/assembly module TamB domain-containing protein [Campylobacterales bacterium]